MIVKTSKLGPTDAEGVEIKVTSDDGRAATFPYPYRHGLDGRDAHAWAVRQLFPAPEYGEPVWIEETARGEKFRVTEA